MDKKLSFSSLILVILIFIFFAIPILSMAVCERVTFWPKNHVSVVYNLMIK
jgi:hypothetical protein